MYVFQVHYVKLHAIYIIIIIVSYYNYYYEYMIE